MPRRRTALIEGGALRTYLYDTYTANREGDAASTGTAARARLPLAALGLGLEPGRRRRRPARLAELLPRRATGVFVTDVAGLHSGVNPVTGVFSVGASGRAIRDGELAEPVREFTIAGELVSMLRARRARPGRRLAGCPSAARSARRRC